jgi:GntR family transcriptional regulator, transcriptional repressor for pyruvate dehydrogenase complex
MMSGQGDDSTEEAMRKDTTDGRVSETITRRIRKAITEGRLAPGEKLPAEREMAQRLRASRVSVREAYRSLAEAGLVSIRRGAEGGAFIADFDPVPVSRSVTFLLRLGRTSHDELTEARALLEPSVARLAARRAGPEELARLEELLRTEQAAPRGSGEARCLHLEFHHRVADCARNLPLAILVRAMTDFSSEVAQDLVISSEFHAHIVGDHARIFEAIRSHDEAGAAAAMLRHVRDAQGRLRRTHEAQMRPSRTAARGAKAPAVRPA